MKAPPIIKQALLPTTDNSQVSSKKVPRVVIDDGLDDLNDDDGDLENGDCNRNDDDTADDVDDDAPWDGYPVDLEFDEARSMPRESYRAFWQRQLKNVVHFFVEDWFLSALLGIITAALSISVDVGIEYLKEFRIYLYEYHLEHFNKYSAFFMWIFNITLLTGAAAIFCHYVSKQAVGSGIPEVKVILHGFAMKNYLTLRTLFAKMVGITLTLGSGLPVGKEGPFVHMGAIVASLLTKATAACRYQAFFSNEGRELQMLSSGCAVGIACTFSAPAGAVLYGIESTSKFFAVRNYWRAFFATTCSALIFRFANAAIIPPEIEDFPLLCMTNKFISLIMTSVVSSIAAGTITAYYQTYFPNTVFVVEEIPVFVIIGVLSGLFGALFVFVHRRIALFQQRRIFMNTFGRNYLCFTFFMAIIIGMITFPEGLGRYFAGKLTFSETLVDFISNCTFSLSNSSQGCPISMIEHWTGGVDGHLSVFTTLSTYLLLNFLLVAICVTLKVPAGIFVPSFVIGACGGRIIGELMASAFPEGIRGADGPQIYPGLYAVVGAAAYTGSVTHSLSIAVIVCETTGQLSPLLPVLIALMVGNAISSFLQPSIYESIIQIKNLPHLAELPPSRISVHMLRVENVMNHKVKCITRETTYKELRELLDKTPGLRSYPLVTDTRSKQLLGSVARKYLSYLMFEKFGPELVSEKQKSAYSASELFSQIRRNSALNLSFLLTDRSISGNTLLANSPLHEDQPKATNLTIAEKEALLERPIDLDEIAIDAAPFQLVLGTSLYRVHTLFSLLGLNHAYVTNRGQLMGVISIKELRAALANIYSRGAVPMYRVRRSIASPPSQTLLSIQRSAMALSEDPSGRQTNESSSSPDPADNNKPPTFVAPRKFTT